jgi:predicted ribosome quality control (RQC) complex YloA/Tae2 family protein
MLIDGKMSYNELEQMVFQIKEKVINSYLKNIYHYEGLWVFKFNHFSFVFVPGLAIWIGDFVERETKLHSISIKIRKEIRDHKVIGFDLVDNDRTVVLQFHNHKVILELYAKGNLILLNNENNIIVLTRIYPNCSHGKEYVIKDYKQYGEDFIVEKYGWAKKDKEISNNFDDFDNIMDAMSALWNVKCNQKTVKKEVKKDKKKKNNVEGNIQKQIDNFTQKIDNKFKLIHELEEVDYEAEDFNGVDYEKIRKLHHERKIFNKKLKGAEDVFNEKSKQTEKKETNSIKVEKIKLETHHWYQKYHWWYTKNNFLVVGGRSATDNEKLVKSYLNDNDYYFHSEDPGSGSFIMFTENREPDFSDIDETAEGVMALSTQWNSSYSSGDVFYVKGSQVSKTPPTGEYIGKGSFMIYGKKEFVKVVSCTLGYGIYENKLMLAPYRIICRPGNKNVKLKPRNDIKKMKGKKMTDALKKTFNIEMSDYLYIFNKPSHIFC